VKKKALGLLLAAGGAVTFSSSVLASFDMDDCRWGTEGCMVTSPPILDSAHDTRDNLIRLVGEKTGLRLPSQPDSIDERKTRSYYFASHYLPEYIDNLVKEANEAAATAVAVVGDSKLALGDAAVEVTNEVTSITAPVIPKKKPAVYEQANAIGISEASLDEFAKQEDSLETRYISNNLESVHLFYTALLDDNMLTEQQRQPLAALRLKIDGSADMQTQLLQLVLEENSTAALFRDYLLAANAFYGGNYDSAFTTFSELRKSKQPWIAETASYMLMRVELNRSSDGDTGEFGDFNVDSVHKEAAQRARQQGILYLQKWPAGLYASSARGLFRRIDWYQGDWDQLALDLEQALKHPQDADALQKLVAEADHKLLSSDYYRKGAVFMTAPDAPQLTFIQTLRLMRNFPCTDNNVCVDQVYLDNIKPIFEKGQALPLWQYLTLWLAYQHQDYTTIMNTIKPVDLLPEHDILAFSQQAMIGNILMTKDNWPVAHQFWQHLLSISKSKEQQQYIQGMLAGVMLYEDKADQIFAADSPITNLNYRSITLKTVATPELLRQQVTNGMNSEEQTIALHTLLIKDLIAGRYGDWLQDKKRISQLTGKIDADHFRDVDLNVFNWKGEQTETGYYCPTLDNIVTTLSVHADDSHALNCLGEFFRTTDASVSQSEADEKTLALGEALEHVKDNGTPDRQSYYMQVINNPQTEPEDKSFALYRAVMCYAPSGFNDCGGIDQEISVRKGWFNQLRKEFPGGIWTRKLKYYW